ncbi:MAG: hypothetical protein CMJ81_02610 [Planctomycetaceae bacterium]|nr:hypothetical protein [Planctomycetaceae bacterium]MBP62113.1 hypothetical protein [Planctomycetaceae bacterium]
MIFQCSDSDHEPAGIASHYTKWSRDIKQGVSTTRGRRLVITPGSCGNCFALNFRTYGAPSRL